MGIETAIIVRGETRLEQLVARFNTKAQTQFYLTQNKQDYSVYQDEHDTFHRALEAVEKQASKHLKVKVLERQYVPRFLFSDKDAVLVVGRDGLVANTAKYAAGRPIFGINPDATRNNGVLLPFLPEDFLVALTQIALGAPHAIQTITLAEAKLNDGQRLLAFNDLFIGPETHTSARYTIQYQGMAEVQSSSGIVVSTGAGSTGWLSSLFNMSYGMQQAFFGKQDRKGYSKGSMKKLPSKGETEPEDKPVPRLTLAWDTEELLFVVREPYESRSSQIGVSAGRISKNSKLVLESHMPMGGKIFSDGIEADYLQFNSGTLATIGLAPEVAHLVLK